MSSNGMKEHDFQQFIINHLTAHGYEQGFMSTYNKEYCVDEEKLFRFLEESQPKVMKKLEENVSYRLLVLQAIQQKIKAGTVLDVWKEGVEVDGQLLSLVYFAPNDTRNAEVVLHYQKNIVSVTEELEYSQKNGNRIDLCVFVNGIPFALFELKNKGTNQSYKHGIRQWKQDRDPSERLIKQVPVFFAMDSQEAYLTTKLQGDKTFFLPFNKGKDGGAGNPIVEGKYSTHYVWEDVFQKDSVLDLINNFVFSDQHGSIVFPRYHQWEGLRQLKADIFLQEQLQNYLFNHSAGSGKTYTITWLSHLLSKLFKDGKKLFDTVIVLTDRLVLDEQLQSSISHIKHQNGVVQVIDENSAQLAEAINSTYPIVITTIQKFAFASEKISTASGNKRFAIIVDEAHSSQTGKQGLTLREALNKKVKAERHSDKYHNLAFFAFTATPKGETLQLFGTYREEEAKFTPFHVYSMRQAIEEHFILDVLQNYTTFGMYFKLLNNSPFNPLVDKATANRIIHQVVGEQFVSHKTPIIVEHFHEKVRPLLHGQGKAMVVAGSIRQAMMYKLEIDRYLQSKGYPYKTIVAFTGETEVDGTKYTEESANGFKTSEIVTNFRKDEFQILIVANKFQTGFDEKRLVGMYIDKSIREIQAVQTLSRLNRVMNGKDTTFILDFVNKVEDIQEAFAEFYEGAKVPEGNYSREDLIQLENQLYRSQVVNFKQIHQFQQLLERVPKEERQAHIYPLLQGSQERYDRLGQDKDQVRKLMKQYNDTFNWLKLICSFDDVDGKRLTLLNNYVYWLLRYISSSDEPEDRETLRREAIAGLIEVTNQRTIKQFEGNIELEAKEKEASEEGAGGGKRVNMEDYLNHILQETNAQVADMYPTMQEFFKDYPDDVKWLTEYIEKHKEIGVYVKSPDNINALLGIAKSEGLKGLRKSDRKGFMRLLATNETKSTNLFYEILNYVYQKFQKYQNNGS